MLLVGEMHGSIQGIKDERACVLSGANPRGGHLEKHVAGCGVGSPDTVSVNGTGSQRDQRKDFRKEVIWVQK